MDTQDIKIFQLDWFAKFLFFIFGAMMFLAPVCILYGLFLSLHKQQGSPSFGFMVLMLLVMMMAGFHTLLQTTVKVTVTSKLVVQSNLIKTNRIPLDSILKVKRVYRSVGGKGSSYLFIKAEQAFFLMGFGFPEKMIDESVSYILEQIRTYYPENYSSMMQKMDEDTKQKNSVAVVNFWRK